MPSKMREPLLTPAGERDDVQPELIDEAQPRGAR